MSIDTSGPYWTGTEAADIDAYLRAYTEDGYPADRFVHATCACGGDQFALLVDADEQGAQRECVRCKATHLICDSEDAWADADPEPVQCLCENTTFQVAAGFSHRADGTVKWITLAHRCTSCGTLGSSVDWKVDYVPTDHLYARV